ncbi:MAG: NAD(P)-dependent oxidoreductase [Ornithinimicrobium sp.]|uniref:NAD(P)-dependent oxidoreductase n=1 Tax=Ornithinimicrobium sp. TaxID=1977084 RepID=UPI003D9B757F
MSVVTVPSSLLDLIGEVAGVELLAWDMQDEPGRRADIEVVVAPNWRTPWLKRLDELPALRAVQLGSAGYEHALPFLPEGVALANAVGVHDTATAELALALVLASQRDLPEHVRAQQERTWSPPGEHRSLADASVLVVGYGGIGRALAARLQACEAQVSAVARTAKPGDGLVEQVHAMTDLSALLPAAQIVVLCTPLTDQTRGLLDATALAQLPDDALVVNVSRGPVLDTDALLAECASGRLRAALDVTDPEPLPAQHPLWSTPGVLISPHTGGNTTAFAPRMARYVRSQLTAYAGQGNLLHTVAGPPAGAAT